MIEIERAAAAIRFLFEMFDLDDDMKSWIGELQGHWPELAAEVAKQEAEATDRFALASAKRD